MSGTFMVLFLSTRIGPNVFRAAWPSSRGRGSRDGQLAAGVTHWNSRVQAFAIGAATVLAMVLTIRLKLRLFLPADHYRRDNPCNVLGSRGPGPSAQAVPLPLIMAYCLSWLQERRLLRYALVIVINFLPIYTGYGIFIAGITLAPLALEVTAACRREMSGERLFLFWLGR
jgi:hypothetical protein